MSFETICSNIVKIMGEYWYIFLVKCVGNTLLLSAITVAFGAILGSLFALAKMSRIPPLRWLVNIIVEVVRGTPILLQLYIGYFIVPQLLPFLEVSDFTSIAVALVINSAAYVSEIIRSGIQAVDRGQTEAARSLGLNGGQTMLRVVLPQAVKNILPALGNEFVVVIKESSIVSIIGIADLMYKANTVRGNTFQPFEPLLVAAVVYFLLTFPLSKLLAYIERRMRKHD